MSKIAIIGGSALPYLKNIQMIREESVTTPYGNPSSSLVHGFLADREVIFLDRHGPERSKAPHEINYRANIYALKSLGATQIIGVSAVGSLREEIVPGDLALPDQYFDWTRGQRANSFFGQGIAAHVSTANPVSEHLADWIAAEAERQSIRLHNKVTYGCVEGPRLGTRAESLFLRQIGCDLVGMTNVPEVFLAREAQICYCTIGIATDYDCWMEDPSKHVTVDSIFALYGQSLSKVQQLLIALLQQELPAEEPEIRQALSHAMMTPDKAMNSEQLAWMSVLRQ